MMTYIRLLITLALMLICGNAQAESKGIYHSNFDFEECEKAYSSNILCEDIQIIEEWKQANDIDLLDKMYQLSNDLPDEISFYATFWLMKKLYDIDSTFVETYDFEVLYEKTLMQTLLFQKKTSDDDRGVPYFIYLFEIMDIDNVQPPKENIFERTYWQVPKKDLEYMVCFVDNDLPYLPPRRIEKLLKFKTCLKDKQ